MEVELTRTERSQMYSVADAEAREDIKAILSSRNDKVIVEGKDDIWEIRNLAAVAIEAKVPERYGHMAISDVYDKCNEVLFEE